MAICHLLLAVLVVTNFHSSIFISAEIQRPTDDSRQAAASSQHADSAIDVSSSADLNSEQIKKKIAENGGNMVADTDGNVQILMEMGKKGPGHEKHSLTVFGVLGENYFTDHGKPYINCAKRRNTPSATNVTALSAGGASTVRCFLDNQKSRERLGCMAVFMYNGTREEYNEDPNPSDHLRITAQDCWQHEEEVVNACALSDRCVFKEDIRFGDVMFCCCNTHNCNDAVHLRSAFPHRFNNTEDSLLDDIQNASRKNRKKSSNEAWSISWLVVVFFAGLVFALAVVLLAYIVYQHCILHPKQKQQGGSTIYSSEYGGTLPETSALIVNKKAPPGMTTEKTGMLDITLIRNVAHGRYGKVYQAKLRTGGEEKEVAVKIFESINIESFIAEREIYTLPAIRTCENSCILRYIGWDNRGAQHWLVFNYLEMGNLYEYLMKNVIPIRQAIRVLLTLLDGLTFLHEERMIKNVYKPTIVHRDLKSRNVLVRIDDQHRISTCIADFGLAMKCDGSEVGDTNQRGQVGTRRYMSPEVLEGATEFTAAAFRQIDVYAMALVMWEVLLRTEMEVNEPVPGYHQPFEKEVGGDPSLAALRDLIIQKRFRPPFRQTLTEHRVMSTICGTIEEMWDMEAEGRITAGCALERLRLLTAEESEGYYSADSRSASGKSIERLCPFHPMDCGEIASEKRRQEEAREEEELDRRRVGKERGRRKEEDGEEAGEPGPPPSEFSCSSNAFNREMASFERGRHETSPLQINHHVAIEMQTR